MKVLGLLDTLESIIVEGTKIPLSKKIMVNEEQVLKIIDKIRLVLQEKDEAQRPNMGEKIERKIETVKTEYLPETDKDKAAEIIQQAYQLAKEIREGADKYADEVLSNIELSTARILRTVKAGRERLVKTVQGKTENVES